MRILVTGGCGFIGSHLVEYHLKKGDEVKTVDNLSTGSLNNIESFKTHASFQFYNADLLTWNELETSLCWADRVYHMAASLGVFHVISQPISMLDTNILGCEYLLRVMVQCKSKARLLVASSSSVYGDSLKPKLSEEDALIVSPATHPVWAYAVSKIADEAYVDAYHRIHHLNVTSVRLFNTVGPRQTGRYGMVIPRFVEAACRNQPIQVYGDGTQTRSFCDVRDSVRALDLIAECGVSLGKPINVGSDTPIRILDLAHLIKQRANSTSSVEHIPYKKAYGIEFKDIKARCPDIQKLKTSVPYQPEWNLNQTLEDLINAFKSRVD